MTEIKPVAWHIPRSISVTKDHDVTDRWRLGNPDTAIEPLYPASAIHRLQERVDELEAALDQREVESGLTSDGNLWRFWSQKAKDVAAKLYAAEARATAAEARLEEARKVIEPFIPQWDNNGLKFPSVTRRGIDIARAFLKGLEAGNE